MEEQERSASAQTTEKTTAPAPGAIWADLRCLALLFLLAAGLRAWQIAHTEVASRDSISYIRIAWQLEHGSWREVLPHSPQHPGYPLTVLGMSLPVRHFIPDDLPRAWQFSAQLASALASVLLVVPMFYLGRELFDRRAAFWACVLFQCLPSSGKVMSDGLSDTLFLLFACAGLWLACIALRRGSWGCFALTGLAGGLAYLTRPEGTLIVGITGLVLLAMQFSRRWRRSWRSVLANGVALSAAALAVMTPYMVLIGGLTVKNTPNLLLEQQRPDADWEGRLRPQARGRADSSTLLAIWWHPNKAQLKMIQNIKDPAELAKFKPPRRYLWALYALYVELSKGFFYLLWLPALLGLWWSRHRFPRTPGAWVMALVCVLLCALLYRMAEKMGYLSDRHLLLVVLCGVYPAAVGAIRLGEKLALGAARLRPALAGSRWTDGRSWSLSLLLLLTLVPLPRTLDRLHGERAGFRSVGRWMAENTCAGNFIEDPYCWTSYYAGRVFLEGCADLPVEPEPCFYVVLEKTKNRHAHLVSLQSALVHAWQGQGSKIIHEEVVRRGKEHAQIVVWRVPGTFRWQPLPGLPGQRR
ncbi:MAG TPA: glycosyltransferase family 39 protein [Gemmataceae bacterium]